MGDARNLGQQPQHRRPLPRRELARSVALWIGQGNLPAGSKGLLLKLSAGLSLAAANAVATSSAELPSIALEPAIGMDMSGVWHSRYVYESGSRGQEFEGLHYVVFRQHGNRLLGQNLPHSTDSRLKLDLSIDGSIVTGVWTERTSPTGHYKGAIYHGTIQLIVNPMGRAMSGKWLGFGNDFKVNTGVWDLTWVNAATSGRAVRKYHGKV